jgi:hypothetical protein
MVARLLILALTVFPACRPAERAREVDTPGSAAPAAVTAAQFQTLRWLEGTWRGTGEGVSPFFERYRFVDDSTIRRYTYVDSSFAQISDSGTTALRGAGVTGGDPEPEWQVTSVDSTGWHFESLREAGRGFTWSRIRDGTWTARLVWRDAQGNPRVRFYTLTRLTR